VSHEAPLPGELAIRSYESRDLDACRALWAALTEWHRRLYEDETIGGADPGRGFDIHLAEVGAKRIWVAELGGRVVGLAGLLEQGEKAELEPIVVDAQHQGRGIGRKLAAAAIDEARRTGARQVVVRPVGRNSEAIRFFHALGFDVLGRVDLRIDVVETARRPGERVAGRPFRV
jgi:GNAT superfamily N-acetyltransferase